MLLPPPSPGDPIWTKLREHDVEELWDPSLSPHVAAAYRGRIALLQAIVGRVAEPPARILDVGCAQGTLGLQLAERGYRVSLLDVRASSIAYARARQTAGEVSFHVGALSATCPPEADFDVVMCTEVLEHVTRPAEVVGRLSERVRAGGHLLVTTPNADYFLSRLPTFGAADQAVIDAAEADSMDGDAHRYFYTREELATLLRGSGLAVVDAGFFSPFWLQGHLKTRLLHRLHYAVRRRPLAVGPSPGGRSWLDRRSCASQWMLCRRAPSRNG